jgi:predicted sugar kinase
MGRLAQTVPKVLNVGLLVAALFHCLELGTLLVDGGVQVGRRPSGPPSPAALAADSSGGECWLHACRAVGC